MLTDLQKATGLRVLRKIVERQHSIERDEEKLLRQLRQLDLPRVRVVVVDDDAGAHVVGDRVLATWQVS